MQGAWKGSAAVSNSFNVDWIRRYDLPFKETEHLTNPLNENKPVKISRDGQELPLALGLQLCRMFDEGADAAGVPKPPPPSKPLTSQINHCLSSWFLCLPFLLRRYDHGRTLLPQSLFSPTCHSLHLHGVQNVSVAQLTPFCACTSSQPRHEGRPPNWRHGRWARRGPRWHGRSARTSGTRRHGHDPHGDDAGAHGHGHERRAYDGRHGLWRHGGDGPHDGRTRGHGHGEFCSSYGLAFWYQSRMLRPSPELLCSLACCAALLLQQHRTRLSGLIVLPVSKQPVQGDSCQAYRECWYDLERQWLSWLNTHINERYPSCRACTP